MFTLLSAVAQLEKANIAERTARGRMKKAAEGYLHCGSVPYGYRYLGKDQGSKGTMVVEENEAAVVRTIFDWCKTGWSLYRIKEQLNQDGIRSARGGAWDRKVILQVLRNEAYVGRSVLGKLTRTIRHLKRELKKDPNNQQIQRQLAEAYKSAVTIPCPAIVDELTFQTVANQLRKNRTQRAGRKSQHYLLSGLVWCKACTHRLATYPNHGRGLYRCGHIDHHVYRRLCPSKGILKAVIERAVWDAIWDPTHGIANPDLVMEWARRYHAAMGQDNEERAGLEKRLARLVRQEARAVEILSDPDAPIAYKDAKANLDKLRAERAVLESEIKQINVFQLPDRRAIQDLCKQFQAGKDLEDFNDRRELMFKVVERIDYDAQAEEVTIRGQIRMGEQPGHNMVGSPDEPAPTGGCRNCDRGVGPDDNLGTPKVILIPFTIKRKVA
jgi:site-specific DNA recombinase